jgi:mannose-6-phosphate isomerase-like protein (cupin superfamily)
MSWKTTSIADLRHLGGDTHWIPVRRFFGITAFGVNGWTGRAGERIVFDHDQTLTGQQEVYLVLSGRAEFVLNEERIDAPAGTLVYVEDPGVRRTIFALVDGTVVFAVGATPGAPYEPPGWERAHDVAVLNGAGEHERAIAVGEELLSGGSQAEWPILYHMACGAAALGRKQQALALLRRGVELEPVTVIEHARSAEVFAEMQDAIDELVA